MRIQISIPRWQRSQSSWATVITLLLSAPIGLKQSARLRSEKAMESTLAALQRSVAAEARASTAWVYGQEELRARIMPSRRIVSHKGVSSGSATQDRKRVSTQNIIATLRLRIKTLEEKNRELTERGESAAVLYSLIAISIQISFPSGMPSQNLKVLVTNW